MQGASRAPVPSVWTPLSMLTSPGSSCFACCLSHGNGTGRSWRKQAGQSQAQHFLCFGLLEGAQPSPLSHFCHKIHVCGFSHSPNPKDTFSHMSPGTSRARLGSTLSQMALPHPTCFPVLASVPVDNQSPKAILRHASPRKDTHTFLIGKLRHTQQQREGDFTHPC